jgi:hypothetical protein
MSASSALPETEEKIFTLFQLPVNRRGFCFQRDDGAQKSARQADNEKRFV